MRAHALTVVAAAVAGTLVGLGAMLIVRARRGRKGIDFTRSLQINAPLKEVFAFWRDFENFPRIMRHVKSVHRNLDGSWHWQVAGPLGKTVHWDSEVTQYLPYKGIAWETDFDSEVEHSGLVLFQEEAGGTRLQIEMTYRPPAGVLGQAVAALFGKDPQREMDEDLARLKEHLESGGAAKQAAWPYSMAAG
jgi:uncharacterized membrane protein